MNPIATVVLVMATLTGAGATVAQEQMTQEQRQNLKPEQLEAARAQARERWKALPPEEMAAAKQRMRERYESFTPEQQAQVRQRMQERHAVRPQGNP
jgi:hypothetical protein